MTSSARACTSRILFRGALVGALALLSLSAAVGVAEAQCRTALDCMGGLCAIPPSSTAGLCVPIECEGLRLAACFSESGGDPMTRFDLGDCDGDRIENAADVGAICSGYHLVTSIPTLAKRQGRIDASTGIPIAPDLFTNESTGLPFGIACPSPLGCPDVAGYHARCVGLDAGLGVCTYAPGPLEDDMSCLGGAGAECAMGLSGYHAWASRDCDGDGLANDVDGRVCTPTRVALRQLDGAVACGEATFSRDACSTIVTPDGMAACPTARVGDVFAVCCTDPRDCPAVGGEVAHCALFSSEAGACTYRRDDLSPFPPIDFSCSMTFPGPALPAECFAGGGGLDYDAWAQGECDVGCTDAINEDDGQICDCAREDAGVVVADASVDAWLDPSLDAGPPPDAWLDPSAFDGGAGVDGGAPGAFAGSGCRCTAVGRGSIPRGLLVLLGLALLGSARSRARLRKPTSPRARAR